jgi:hypothetical protein
MGRLECDGLLWNNNIIFYESGIEEYRQNNLYHLDLVFLAQKWVFEFSMFSS